MGKQEKLLAKARQSPQNITFSELESLAEAYSLPLKPGGSHYIQRLPDGRKNTIKREGNKVKKWYVKEVVEAIEEFGLAGKESDSETESNESSKD